MASTFFPGGRPRQRWPLFCLGSLSGIFWLLAFTLPYWLSHHYHSARAEIYRFTAEEPWRGILFYGALAALFGFYWVAYHLASHLNDSRAGAWLVGIWTLVFCLLLIPVYPLTSSDVYGYLFEGRIVAVLGENPFVHLYRDFAGDPFYSIVTFHHLPASTGYGPLWIAITAGLGWLARGRLLLNLFLFKGLAAGLHLVSVVLLYATLSRLAPERRLAGTLFYAWNPLLLYELVGNAHNDVALAALALLAFYLLSRRRGLLAVPCLAAAALIKPVALLWLLPLAVWLLARESRWLLRLRRGVILVLLALLPVVVAYAPFWQGVDTFQGLLAQSNIHGNSLPALLIGVGRSLWPGAKQPIVDGVKLLTLAFFAPFYLWQLATVWRVGLASWRQALSDLMRVAFDVMLFFLLLVTLQFWGWYLTWLLAPAALLDEQAAALRRPLVLGLCLMALLLYFPFGWQWVRAILPAWAVGFLSALPTLIGGTWILLRWRRRPAGG